MILKNNGEVNAIFSIIIPAYNAQDYISEAILSCLEQTFEDFEAIIVNDVSSDDTLIFAKEFAKNDKRVKDSTKSKNHLLRGKS